MGRTVIAPAAYQPAAMNGWVAAPLLAGLAWFGWAAHEAESEPSGGPDLTVDQLVGVLEAQHDMQAVAARAYIRAAQNAPCPLDYRTLAGMGWIESGHGRRQLDPVTGVASGAIVSSAAARGPMQFIRSTWDRYATDGDGDGATNIDDVDDATASSAKLLCASNVDEDWDDAVGSYNGGAGWRNYAESQLYVPAVRRVMESLPPLNGGARIGAAPQAAAASDDDMAAILRLMGESGRRRWDDAGEVVHKDGDDGYLDHGYGYLDPGVRAALDKLAPSSKPGASAPPRAPSTGRFALPLPVEHVPADELDDPHHDYPAFDIGVPTGTPVFAPEAGVVVAVDNGACGVGVAIAGDSGFRWGLCHFDRRVIDGGRVSAGQQVGESGNTGHSTGPHLHVQITSPSGGLVCPQPSLLAWRAGDVARAPSETDGTNCSY